MKLRRLTHDWFLPANLRKLEADDRAVAKDHVDRMAALGGDCDFVNEVALFYPLRVIMRILGVPESDEPMMLRMTQEMFGAQDPDVVARSKLHHHRRRHAAPGQRQSAGRSVRRWRRNISPISARSPPIAAPIRATICRRSSPMASSMANRSANRRR